MPKHSLIYGARIHHLDTTFERGMWIGVIRYSAPDAKALDGSNPAAGFSCANNAMMEFANDARITGIPVLLEIGAGACIIGVRPDPRMTNPNILSMGAHVYSERDGA